MKAAALTQPNPAPRPLLPECLTGRRQDSKVNGDLASFAEAAAPRSPGAPRLQNRRVSLAFRGIAGKGREEQMEQNALFRKRYGSFRRFFAMLGKARLPYLWIVGYLAVSALIANVSVSTTEYSAALFAARWAFSPSCCPTCFLRCCRW